MLLRILKLSKPVLIETLGVIAATAPDIEKHRDAISDSLRLLVLAKTEAAPALALCPAPSFVCFILQEIARLASDAHEDPPERFARGLLAAGGTGHVAIEDALLNSLKTGLGPLAKPILLNAWGAGFWLLIASYRIRLNC